MAPHKIIIDTDPGVDDTLAMLLAFSALREELEVLLISVTYGNIDVQNCSRNVVSLFHQIEKEIAWREANGKPKGFDALLSHEKPLVAIGPQGPLADQILLADYFHGRDGLGGISLTHPHLVPPHGWDEIKAQSNGLAEKEPLFRPSDKPSHQEILRLLRENEPDTITIVAVGPLTNMALAAAEDPEAFLRVKEVVVMGGNVEEPGNMTPVAEFNTFADAYAAARVYALSSPNPSTTMPPIPPPAPGKQLPNPTPPHLGSYPTDLSRRLKTVLFPLDITNYHLISRGSFNQTLAPLLEAKSPLAEWVSAFMHATFNTVEALQREVSGDAVGLQLHDPLCVWYCITGATDPKWKIKRDEDLRVETAGQWTRGMCLVDRRTRKKREEAVLSEAGSDHGNWLSTAAGNRLGRCIETPGKDVFGGYLLKTIFNL